MLPRRSANLSYPATFLLNSQSRQMCTTFAQFSIIGQTNTASRFYRTWHPPLRLGLRLLSMNAYCLALRLCRPQTNEEQCKSACDLYITTLITLSNMDIGVLQLLNAHQREMQEWPELFRRADSRYHYLGVKKPEGAIRWIIEAEWRG